jgi:hypothetical protein
MLTSTTCNMCAEAVTMLPIDCTQITRNNNDNRHCKISLCKAWGCPPNTTADGTTSSTAKFPKHAVHLYRLCTSKLCRRAGWEQRFGAAGLETVQLQQCYVMLVAIPYPLDVLGHSMFCTGICIPIKYAQYMQQISCDWPNVYCCYGTSGSPEHQTL